MEPAVGAPSEASDIHMREQLRGVNQLHEGVDRMRADLKRLSKLSKAYASSSEPLNDLGLEIAEHLQDFGTGKDETETFVRQSGEMLKLTEAMRQLLVQQLESGFAEPLRIRLETDVVKESAMKDLHKQWTSAGEAYTDAHKKWNKAKDPRGSIRPSGNKINKIESDVSDARNVFEKVTSDYNARLKEMETLSKQELVEFLNNYMQANISFFVSGYQLMKSMEPTINAISASIAKAKGEPPKEEKPVADIFTLKPSSAALPVKSGATVTKQGYLFKKKSSGLKGWGIRWFVLDDNGRLTWFKSWKKFTQQSESLNIFYATVRPSDAGNLIFEIISKSRATLHLKALNVQDFNDWLNTFSKAIQLNISVGTNITAAERAELLAQQKRMDDEVRLASPANTVCADCNAPQPDWASINLGILLCIECSGVHRSLGSHISKIRSLTLDLWEPEHVEIMKHIGNAKANGFWEAELPREFLKPDEKTVRRLREVWIDNKYKAKAFLPKDRIPAESLFQTMKDAAVRLDLITVEKCVAYGAEVNAKNLGDCSKTVAHYLAESGNQIATEFLFQNGADLNIKDAKGNLPIHYAAQRGHLEVFRLLLHRGADLLINEQNAEGHSVSDLAVLHPTLTEVLEKRREKIAKSQTPSSIKPPAGDKEKEREGKLSPRNSTATVSVEAPATGSKLKRAASAYSPRSTSMLSASSPPASSGKVEAKPAGLSPGSSSAAISAGKNPTAPDPGSKPPVKPKPAHLSRRKLSDGAVNPKSGSQLYAAMPGIDQEGPAPPEGTMFAPLKQDDTSPRPPAGTSPRLSLRRSPPSAPAVTGNMSPPKDKEEKKKKEDKKEKEKANANVPISAPSNFRHVTHYESADAPALIQQAESKKKLKGDAEPAVAIGGPSGFRHVGSWQDQFDKDKKSHAAPVPAVKTESVDDLSSVSERKESLEKRALYPYPQMSVEVIEEASVDSRRQTASNGSDAPQPATPSSPPDLNRSHSTYPPPPPGDSELSPREESP